MVDSLARGGWRHRSPRRSDAGRRARGVGRLDARRQRESAQPLIPVRARLARVRPLPGGASHQPRRAPGLLLWTALIRLPGTRQTLRQARRPVCEHRVQRQSQRRARPDRDHQRGVCRRRRGGTRATARSRWHRQPGVRSRGTAASGDCFGSQESADLLPPVEPEGSTDQDARHRVLPESIGIRGSPTDAPGGAIRNLSLSAPAVTGMADPGSWRAEIRRRACLPAVVMTRIDTGRESLQEGVSEVTALAGACLPPGAVVLPPCRTISGLSHQRAS